MLNPCLLYKILSVVGVPPKVDYYHFRPQSSSSFAHDAVKRGLWGREWITSLCALIMGDWESVRVIFNSYKVKPFQYMIFNMPCPFGFILDMIVLKLAYILSIVIVRVLIQPLSWLQEPKERRNFAKIACL